MSVGKHFIFSLLSGDDHAKKMIQALDVGVDDGYFLDDAERYAWQYIRDRYLEHGSVPSIYTVEVETDLRFPDYELQDPFSFWLDELRKYNRLVLMHNVAHQLSEYLNEGQEQDAFDLIQQSYSRLKLMRESRRQVKSLSELSEEILQRHHLIQTGQLQEGIPFGIPYLDQITGGAQPGNLIAVVGESGAGKTFTTLRFCEGAVRAGYKAMYVTMEMTNAEAAQRSLALHTHVDGTALRLGRLSHFAIDCIRNSLSRWADAGYDDKLIFVEGQLRMTVDDIMANVQEHKPDVLYIDGAYMLKLAGSQNRQRWETSTEIMEMVKRVAIITPIPVIATFQFDQKARDKKLHNIMGGQHISQIASLVLGLENDQALATASYESRVFKTLSFMKGRFGEQGKIRLRYDMQRTEIEQEEVLMGDRRFTAEPTEPDMSDEFE
jgi:replicative DNA helicase